MSRNKRLALHQRSSNCSCRTLILTTTPFQAALQHSALTSRLGKWLLHRDLRGSQTEFDDHATLNHHLKGLHTNVGVQPQQAYPLPGVDQKQDPRKQRSNTYSNIANNNQIAFKLTVTGAHVTAPAAAPACCCKSKRSCQDYHPAMARLL